MLVTKATACVAACAAVALAAGCGNRESPRFDGAQASSVVTATVGADGVQRVDLRATDADRFVPNSVVVHPGKVTVVLHNTGVVPHTFEIPSLRVATGNVGKHAVKSVTFTVDKPGSYPFVCAYHVTLHMEGTLKVVAG
jgi:plastocyanin